MRRYIFHSRLTAETFRHSLPYRAKQRAGEKLRAEVSGDEIRLMDCGSLQIYGQIPFVGRVSAEEGAAKLRAAFRCLPCCPGDGCWDRGCWPC